jgi:hypothetical protein
MVRTTLWATLALIASLAPLASADIEFTKPKAGEELEGGSTIEITWKDSGDKPALEELTTYELFLCAGGNEPGSYVSIIRPHTMHSACCKTKSLIPDH